jgi:hypothetical protein
MFNPVPWKIGGSKFDPAYTIVSEDGEQIATVGSAGDAKLIRCAPDMHQFLVDLLDSNTGLGRFRDRAERLRHRAEGISA